MAIHFLEGATMFAPNEYDGKHKVFEETYLSAGHQKTADAAFRVLESIRDSHPTSEGWVEFEAGVQQLPDGNWQAFRMHAKYE